MAGESDYELGAVAFFADNVDCGIVNRHNSLHKSHANSMPHFGVVASTIEHSEDPLLLQIAHPYAVILKNHREAATSLDYDVGSAVGRVFAIVFHQVTESECQQVAVCHHADRSV